MSQKTLLGLIVIAILVIVAAIAIQHANQPLSDTAGQTQKLLPDLRAHVNDIDKVVFTGAGSKTIATLTRGKDGWSVAEKGGYAADTGKLREFLLKLSAATVLEKKTSNKEKYADLGVQDVAADDAKGVLVEIDGVGQPTRLIIGSPDSSGRGTFVRRAGDAQSLLVSGRLSAGKDRNDWLRKDLADIAAKRIADVTIRHGDGHELHVHKNAEGDADFSLMDLPKGREIVSAFTVNGVASTLSGLRLDDVLPAKDAAPDDQAIEARYATFDGLVVDVTAWSRDGKDYARFKASLDREQADRHIAAGQADAKARAEAGSAENKEAAADTSPSKTQAGDETGASADATAGTNAATSKPLAVSDPARDRANKLAALGKEVADLNARFDGWTFVLPSYKYSSIDKSQDDLLKPLAGRNADKDKGKSAKKTAKKGGKAAR
ncbi:MAG TPA: DUF4340 domain-containing protein [Rhodanobacteraceae bacterium]|nr:DUF4340 domain-containing protein [Rhodanobacteraceae bacterium]